MSDYTTSIYASKVQKDILFPSFDNYKLSFYKHLCVDFCVDVKSSTPLGKYQ